MKHPVEVFVELAVEEMLEEAAQYRRRGLIMFADLVESIVNDLETGAQAWLDEPIPLPLAAEISRYSASTLQRRVALGELPDAGERGRPRIRRRHVPIRAEVEAVTDTQTGGASPAPASDAAQGVDIDPVQAAAMDALADFEAELRDSLTDDVL